MRTTRRKLLALLGLGAAAAAIGAGKAEAGRSHGGAITTWTAGVVTPRYPGDTDLSTRCVACGWQTPWTNETSAASVGADIDRMDAHMAQAHGSQQYTETVWRPHEDAIAQDDTAYLQAQVDHARTTGQPFVLTDCVVSLSRPLDLTGVEYHITNVELRYAGDADAAVMVRKAW